MTTKIQAPSKEDLKNAINADIPQGIKGRKPKYYPKDKFFNQSIDMVDRKSKIPKAVSVPVDYRIIKFKHGEVKFVKGQEVSKTELALINDYQKEFYLDAK